MCLENRAPKSLKYYPFCRATAEAYGTCPLSYTAPVDYRPECFSLKQLPSCLIPWPVQWNQPNCFLHGNYKQTNKDWGKEIARQFWQLSTWRPWIEDEIFHWHKGRLFARVLQQLHTSWNENLCPSQSQPLLSLLCWCDLLWSFHKSYMSEISSQAFPKQLLLNTYQKTPFIWPGIFFTGYFSW